MLLGNNKKIEPQLDPAAISKPVLGVCVAPVFDKHNASLPDSKAAKKNDKQAATSFCKIHRRVQP